MSSPSDPPPAPERAPQAMTIPAALGWTIAATLGMDVLRLVQLKLRPGMPYDMVGVVGCQAAAYLGVLFLVLRVHAPAASIRDFLGLRRTHAAFYPLALLLGATVWLPAEILAELIQRRWPLPKDELGAVFHAASPAARAGIVLAMAVVGPAVEEILFRGTLFRALRRSHLPWLVIATTAGLFALVHLAWQVFLPIGLLGLLLGFVRARSGSLIPSFLVHGCFNAVTCTLIALTKAGAEDADLNVPNAFVLGSLGAAVVLIGAIHLLGARGAAVRARELDLA